MNQTEFQICCPKKNPLIVGNTVFKPITDFALTEAEKEKARVVLGERDDTRRFCLQELKKALSADEDDADYKRDNEYLLRYLRTKKFNSKKAYNCLKQLRYFKENKPEFFSSPKNLRHLLNQQCLTILPYSDEDGRILFWCNIEKWNTKEISFEELISTFTYIYDLISMNPRCQINGVVGFWDMKGLSRNHIFEILKKQRLQRFFSFVQTSYPWRVKKTFVFNTGQLTRIIYGIIRPLLIKKIRDRVVLLGSDLSELHEYTNPAILPKMLGGQLEDDNCNITPFVMENMSYLQYIRSCN